ncbi:MAG: acetylglutamate kinase [Clostridiales bacterium]|nr:acetylglutamate kinase [Clostridiales bacterium]
MEIKKVDSQNSDFLLLKGKLENFLDKEYEKYNSPREQYRSSDENIDLTAVYIAYDNKTPIGIAGFKMKNETIAELKKVFVLEGHTGSGVAMSLVALIESDAKECGATHMILKTGDPLRFAVDLYLRLGYEFIPNYAPYVGDNTAICMRKSLEDHVWSGEKRAAVREGISYLNIYRGDIFVIKYDGLALRSDEARASIISDIKMLAQSGIKIILIHGGKPYIEEEIKKQGVISEFIGGRRVTTPKILEIIETLYLREISPKLSMDLSAVGVALSGQKGQLLLCEKKKIKGKNLGLVGTIKEVNRAILDNLLVSGLVPIISPIGTDETGQAYNVLPEEVATAIAKIMKAEKLIFISDKDGILHKDGTVVSEMDVDLAERLKDDICESMYPKVISAVDSVQSGVKSVHIINGTRPDILFDEIMTHNGAGTMFVEKLAYSKHKKVLEKLKGEHGNVVIS